MRTWIKRCLICVVFLAAAGRAFAYPPDNAAVLYYKCFMLLEEPNDVVGKMLGDLQKGNIGLNEQIRRYIERNRKVIDEIVTAAEIKNCDWGLDFSEGLELMMPQLAKCRQMSYLLAADAKVLAEKGDYREALERCITIYKMARHAGDDTLVQGLVGIAIGGLADDSVIELLPKVSDDKETLEWLRMQLADVSSRLPSMRVAITKEAEVCSQYISREKILVMADVAISDMPKDKLERILKDDDEFYAKAREYYKSVMAKMQSAFDLSYSQAFQEFENLHNEIENSLEEKPEAYITMFLFPAIGKCCMIEARGKTHLNAVLAGIDVYLIKAKTGKLPDELPAGLAKDMFSDKDFLYAKTDAGFILKCQGKDIDNTVHQYEFNVVK